MKTKRRLVWLPHSFVRCNVNKARKRIVWYEQEAREEKKKE